MIIVIIVPTYNEAENIGILIDMLLLQIERIEHKVRILVVDDSSPDGTACIVKEKMEISSLVCVLDGGRKMGLGAAYIRGFQYALSDLDADAVMEMDADFSHDPEDVPRLINALDEGADFVIASRYVSEGTIPDSWRFMRRLNSLVGNLVARSFCGLGGTRDCTAGFRAIKTGILRKIDLEALGVKGYVFQVALLREALLAGAIVRELPVHFADRKKGQSKLGLQDVWEFIAYALGTRIRMADQFLSFCCVGAMGVVVNLGAFTLLLIFGVNRFMASPMAIEISIINNFLLNNFWTFRERDSNRSLSVKGAFFNAVSLVALLISYSTFVALNIVFPDTVPQVHQAASIIPATLVNYSLNSRWTFSEADDRR